MISSLPSLEAGDCLTRDEFERRYDAMPHLKRAELIEGVVYLQLRVPHTGHGRPHFVLGGWLSSYELETRGLIASNSASVRLDLDNEPQPDLLLGLPEQLGGALRIDDDGILEGPPELILEVTTSSVSYDLHQKKHAYRRNGVCKYVVHRVADREVDWFVLDRGNYVRQEPDVDGLLKSRVFPGLWLDVHALLTEKLPGLQAAIARGCRTPEHAQFRARLAGTP